METTSFFRHFLILFSLLVYGYVFSQKLEWEQSYGGIHAEYLQDAIPTSDYGFILAGSSVSGKTGNKKQDNAGNLDYWIWKMNEHGEQEWQKSFGGSGRDLLYSVANTYDGGFILGGSSDSNATEAHQVHTTHDCGITITVAQRLRCQVAADQR